MILYHLEKLKYANFWPPEGTLHSEGRWNRVGQWVIYTSPTISLTKLEILANESIIPIKRVCITLEVCESAKVFDVVKQKLPPNWIDTPYPIELTNFTNIFLKEDYLLMKVPSAQSQREFNYLVNVRHQKFNKCVKVIDVREEPFDNRLLLS